MRFQDLAENPRSFCECSLDYCCWRRMPWAESNPNCKGQQVKRDSTCAPPSGCSVLAAVGLLLGRQQILLSARRTTFVPPQSIFKGGSQVFAAVGRVCGALPAAPTVVIILSKTTYSCTEVGTAHLLQRELRTLFGSKLLRCVRVII